jgi:hypothetical protein
MPEYKHCKTCDEFHYTDIPCSPIHLVWHEDYMGDEPKKIYASDHRNAAIKYADFYNTHNEYTLMNDTVEVIVERDGVKKRFNISAEPDIYYTASEVTTE